MGCSIGWVDETTTDDGGSRGVCSVRGGRNINHEQVKLPHPASVMSHSGTLLYTVFGFRAPLRLLADERSEYNLIQPGSS